MSEHYDKARQEIERLREERENLRLWAAAHFHRAQDFKEYLERIADQDQDTIWPRQALQVSQRYAREALERWSTGDDIESLHDTVNQLTDERVCYLRDNKRLRAALKRLESLAQDPRNVRIMRQVTRKIASEALEGGE